MSAAVSRIVAKRVLPAGRFGGVLVVVVLALTATATLSLAAAARRTATAFDRFVEWSAPWDLSLGGGPSDQERRIGEMRDFPAVAAMVALPSVGEIDVGSSTDSAPVLIDIDGRLSGFTRAKILEGQVPANDASDQVILGASLADRLDVSVGDDVPVQLFDGTSSSLQVAAVIVTINEFPSLTSLPISTAVVPAGFAKSHPDAVVVEGQTWLVRLADGPRGMQAFREESRVAGLGDVDITTETAEQRDAMHRILRTQAFALWLTAAIAAIAGLLATYQFLRRAATVVAPSLATMRTLGTRRVEVTAGGAMRGALLGAVAATLACASAVAVSRLFPRGVARLAEPDLGVHVDPIVLTFGALALVLAGAGLGAGAVWSATRHARLRDSVRAVPVPGAGPIASGVRFALEPDARGVGSLRPGLLGVGATVAMLVAVSTLGSSFDQLLGKAELSGGWWDAFITAQGSDADEVTHGVETILAALRSEPGIAGLARGGWMSDTTLDGVSVPTMSLEPGAGIEPAMRAGQDPVGPAEIALAAMTMRELGVALGDVVEFGLPQPDGQPPPPIRLTVVGEVALSSPAFFDLGPGEGALVSHALVKRWSPQTAAVTPLLLRFPEGADPSSGLGEILDGLDSARPFAFLRSDRGDVAALHDLKTVPWLLALGVAALTLATLAHRVATSARRHRRDYGVMRALGATRRHVRVGVAAQASTIALVAFTIGVPLGLLLAFLAWDVVADELIVVPEVHVASGPLAAIMVVIVGLTMVVALLVGHGMQRRRPADLLHAE